MSESEILAGVKKLYDVIGDNLYLALKDEDEKHKMIMKSCRVLRKHNYLSPNETYIEESFYGIAEKILLNGRRKESEILKTLFKSTKDSAVESDSINFSVTHRMLKLLMVLSTAPSLPGKYTDVAFFPDIHSNDVRNVDVTGNPTDDETVDYSDEEESENMKNEYMQWHNEFDESEDDIDDGDNDQHISLSNRSKSHQEYLQDVIDSYNFDKESNDNVKDNGNVASNRNIPILEEESSLKEDTGDRVDRDMHANRQHDMAMISDTSKTKYGYSDLNYFGKHIMSYSNQLNARTNENVSIFLDQYKNGVSDACYFSLNAAIELFPALMLPSALPKVHHSHVHVMESVPPVTCHENDVCKMVLECMQGYENDIFRYNHDCKEYIFTPTGCNVQCTYISSGALHHILEWFKQIANKLLAIRHFLRNTYDAQYIHNMTAQDTSQMNGGNKIISTQHMKEQENYQNKSLRGQESTESYICMDIGYMVDGNAYKDMPPHQKSPKSPKYTRKAPFEDSSPANQGRDMQCEITFKLQSCVYDWIREIDKMLTDLEKDLSENIALCMSKDIIHCDNDISAAIESETNEDDPKISSSLVPTSRVTVLSMYQKFLKFGKAINYCHDITQMYTTCVTSYCSEIASSNCIKTGCERETVVGKGDINLSTHGHGSSESKRERDFHLSFVHLLSHVANQCNHGSSLLLHHAPVIQTSLRHSCHSLISRIPLTSYYDKYISFAHSVYNALSKSYLSYFSKWMWSSKHILQSNRTSAAEYDEFSYVTLLDVMSSFPSPLDAVVTEGMVAKRDLMLYSKYRDVRSEGKLKRRKKTVDMFSSRYFLSCVPKLINAFEFATSFTNLKNDFFDTSLLRLTSAASSPDDHRFGVSRDEVPLMHLDESVLSEIRLQIELKQTNSLSESESECESQLPLPEGVIKVKNEYYNWKASPQQIWDTEKEVKPKLTIQDLFSISRTYGIQLKKVDAAEIYAWQEREVNNRVKASSIILLEGSNVITGHDDKMTIVVPNGYADMLSTTQILSKILLYGPVSTTIRHYQKLCVNMLIYQYQLIQHMQFIRNNYYCWNYDIIVLPFKMVMLENETNSTNLYKSHAQMYEIIYNITRHLKSTVMTQIPKGYPEALLNVHFGYGSEGASSCSDNIGHASRTGGGVSTGDWISKQVFELIDSLIVQLHYKAPLNDIFPPTHIAIYSRHLRVILKMYTCTIYSELIWKKITDTDCVLSNICSMKRCAEDRGSMASRSKKDTLNLPLYQDDEGVERAVKVEESGSAQATSRNLILRQLYNKCIVGLMWLLNTVKALQQHYMYSAHEIYFKKIIKQYKTCSSISHIQFIQENTINALDVIFSLQYNQVILFLEFGMVCITALNEAYSAAETGFNTSEEFMSLFYGDKSSSSMNASLNQFVNNTSNIGSSAVHMIYSRLLNASKCFVSLKEHLQTMTKELKQGFDVYAANNFGDIVVNVSHRKLWENRASMLLSLLGEIKD